MGPRLARYSHLQDSLGRFVLCASLPAGALEEPGPGGGARPGGEETGIGEEPGLGWPGRWASSSPSRQGSKSPSTSHYVG